jgi:hypothetical protein
MILYEQMILQNLRLFDQILPMRYLLLITLLSISPSLAVAQAEIRIPVSEYNPEVLKEDVNNPRWSELKLPRREPTFYTLVDTGEVIAIKAKSMNTASGLVYKVDIDPAEYPIVEWTWKVSGPVENGNYQTKDGDDYAARIYITFDYDKKKLKFGDRVKYEALRTFSRFPIPLRAINYIWANNADVGTIAPNAYTNWVYMIAAESGPEHAGAWKIQSQNIFEDYLAAFGEVPPRISGIAIMSDTDNTKGSAEAYYGDIIFRSLDKND